jgi:hypothetical protein
MRRARRQGLLTARAIELAIAAPAVVTTRTLRMLSAGATPDAADRREMLRMGSEKAQAFGAAYVAMAVEMQRQQLAWWARAMHSLWLAPWSLSRSPLDGLAQMSRAWEAVAARGLAPVQRTATANARRLHRAPRR